jgi:hypothetical protein
MGRRASGHLEELPSGGFRVDVYAGTDPLTGRRLRYRRKVKTEQQARIVLGQLLEQAAERSRSGSDLADTARDADPTATHGTRRHAGTRAVTRPGSSVMSMPSLIGWSSGWASGRCGASIGDADSLARE